MVRCSAKSGELKGESVCWCACVYVCLCVCACALVEAGYSVCVCMCVLWFRRGGCSYSFSDQQQGQRAVPRSEGIDKMAAIIIALAIYPMLIQLISSRHLA